MLSFTRDVNYRVLLPSHFHSDIRGIVDRWKISVRVHLPSTRYEAECFLVCCGNIGRRILPRASSFCSSCGFEEATKNNLLVVLVGAFFSAGIFAVLVLWVAAVLNISKPSDENTVALISWMIGGLIGSAIVAWRMTRPRPPSKRILG